jgi:hypothetical protein
MKYWIKKTHIIYSISFILFGLSLLLTAKWTTNERFPIVFSDSNFQLKIKRYPFSLQVKNKYNNNLVFHTLKLTDQINHILPLDYLIEPKKKSGRSYASSHGLNHESHSFIVSSHMRKELRYRVTFRTRSDGINISLFPMNSTTKRFSENKKLNLIIHNNNPSSHISNDMKEMDTLTFFQSRLFTINKIKDKISQLKVNKFHNNISLSSANNEMFFSLNFAGVQAEISEAKVTYQQNSLK